MTVLGNYDIVISRQAKKTVLSPRAWTRPSKEPLGAAEKTSLVLRSDATRPGSWFFVRDQIPKQVRDDP